MEKYSISLYEPFNFKSMCIFQRDSVVRWWVVVLGTLTDGVWNCDGLPWLQEDAVSEISQSHVEWKFVRWLRRLAREQQSPFLWSWRLVCQFTATQKGFDWFVLCLLDHFEPLEDICKYLWIFLFPCVIVFAASCTFGAVLLLILLQYYRVCWWLMCVCM